MVNHRNTGEGVPTRAARRLDAIENDETNGSGTLDRSQEDAELRFADDEATGAQESDAGAREEFVDELPVRGNADAVIVSSFAITPAEIRRLNTTRIPLIGINTASQGFTASVGIDDKAGIRLIVRHLTTLGHRNLLYLYETFDATMGFSSHNRVTGFLEACSELDGVTGQTMDMQAGDDPVAITCAYAREHNLGKVVVGRETGHLWPWQRSFAERLGRAAPELEVVLVARKSRTAVERWVYTDVGKFSGLIETMDEAIKFPIWTEKKGEMEEVVIAGPTCDSADIMYENYKYGLPLNLAIGDRLYWLSTGAYTTSYSAVEFNGLDRKSVV